MCLFFVVCLVESLRCFALREATAWIALTFSSSSPQAAQGGGHRTLLYGHAILLRHSFSEMVSALGCALSPFRQEGKGRRGKAQETSECLGQVNIRSHMEC